MCGEFQEGKGGESEGESKEMAVYHANPKIHSPFPLSFSLFFNLLVSLSFSFSLS
jgi:hypothetical protein